jgi:hypothetical protein
VAIAEYELLVVPWQIEVGPEGVDTWPTLGSTVIVITAVRLVLQFDSMPERVYVVFTVGLTVIAPEPLAPAGFDDHE